MEKLHFSTLNYTPFTPTPLKYKIVWSPLKLKLVQHFIRFLHFSDLVR